jgi:hypothetical protein
MKATELPYGKFQTAVFKLAQEMDAQGAEAVSRLDTDEGYRKRVAHYMLAGAPAQILITADERKSAFIEEIEALEQKKGLSPREAAIAYYKEQDTWSGIDWEKAPEHHLQRVTRNYLFETRTTTRINSCHALAKVLGTSIKRLERLNQKFESPVQLELDPRIALKDFLPQIPGDIKNLGHLLIWLSNGGKKEETWHEIAAETEKS